MYGNSMRFRGARFTCGLTEFAKLVRSLCVCVCVCVWVCVKETCVQLLQTGV